MLSRTHRFHGLNSLSFAYRHGQVVRGPELALKYSLNKRRQTYRVAVVVSKKVDKSAVVRNRIRRRVYEAFRTLDSTVSQPYDLIFTVFSSQVATMPMPELQQQIRKRLRQASAI